MLLSWYASIKRVRLGFKGTESNGTWYGGCDASKEYEEETKFYPRVNHSRTNEGKEFQNFQLTSLSI